MLKAWLAHPLTRGKDIDAPETTALRCQILHEKTFLRRIYQEWYRAIARDIPDGPGKVLEVGSGAGFLRDFVPGLITSDILPLPGIDLVVDGSRLPFEPGELRGLTMVNVLHHIPRVEEFFQDAARCLRPGGAIVLLEPWNSMWSRAIYQKLHHEPFDPQARDWSFPAGGPLSTANGALPWILFVRDKERFERQFPYFRVERIEPTMPLRYLLSGGIAMRSLMPGFTFGFWRLIEKCFSPWMHRWAMFAHVVIRRTEVAWENGAEHHGNIVEEAA